MLSSSLGRSPFSLTALFRLSRRNWFRLVATLSAVVLLLVANDFGGWGLLPPELAIDLWVWGFIGTIIVALLTRPSADGATGFSTGFSDEVRPGFERTFQRRRWTTVGVMSVGLLLWANSKFEWGFFGSAAGILAAVGMTAATTVFFAVGPSPAEMRAYKGAQRRRSDAGAGPA
jgi:hypothetical protein